MRLIFSMIKSLFIIRTNNLFVQFFRYFIVGGLAFIVDFGILLFLTFFPFFRKYYILSASISFLCGLITNYLISIFWVFTNRTINKFYNEFIIFSLIGIIGLGLNSLLIWIFTEFIFNSMFYINDIQIRIITSKILTAILVFLWNFFARKLILFR